MIVKLRYAGRMPKFVREIVLFTIGAWLATSGTLGAQTRDNLREKYGEPISETFLVRPDVNVTATFGTNRRITEYVVFPQNRNLIKSREQTLNLDSVKAIVDELVPPSTRGKHQGGEFVDLACLPENDCRGSSDIYERVTIYYNAAVKGRVHYAVIQMRE